MLFSLDRMVVVTRQDPVLSIENKNKRMGKLFQGRKTLQRNKT